MKNTLIAIIAFILLCDFASLRESQAADTVKATLHAADATAKKPDCNTPFTIR